MSRLRQEDRSITEGSVKQIPNTTTVIKIRHLKEKRVPSADRIAAFPSERGIAPSKTPCGQMYLQKNGSPIPIEFVISIGRRITKTIRMMYFRYLSGFNRAVENFFPGIY